MTRVENTQTCHRIRRFMQDEPPHISFRSSGSDTGFELRAITRLNSGTSSDSRIPETFRDLS
jgi:hypothetical protein